MKRTIKKKGTMESVYSLLLRGKKLLSDGEPYQAALILERAREKEPLKGSILEPLGVAYIHCKRYEKAAESFRTATEVDPTNDYAHYCLGFCMWKLGQRTEAIKHVKLAWYLRPRDEYLKLATRIGARVWD